MRLFGHKDKKAGMPPGSIVHLGDEETTEVKISIAQYNRKNYIEKEVELDQLKQVINQGESKVNWININGVHDEQVIADIGEIFDIHPLVLEDIANTEQRPKLDIHDKYLFLVLPVLLYDEKDNEAEVEQISLLLGRNYVITFQEDKYNFNAIKERIKNKYGNLRKRGADYLAYALIDSIVDDYYLSLELLGEEIEQLENEMLDNPNQEIFSEIKQYRNEIYVIRKFIRPLRGVLRSVLHLENSLIDKSIRKYIKDVYDHVLEITDMVSLLHDMLNNSFEFYMSNSSNKMNEVMQVLTIIATLFIPLTFITGLYGMNFKYMPELESKVGYPVVLFVMLITVVGLLVYFKKKKWF